MMWRSRFVGILLVLAAALHGQNQPPAAVPPPLAGEMTLDELLYPMAYYLPNDDVLFETSDSLIASRKVKRVYFKPEGDLADDPQDMYYADYSRDGKLVQSSATDALSGDSTVHRWNYDHIGLVKNYLTLTYIRLAGGKIAFSGDSISFKYSPSGDVTEISRYSVQGAGHSKTSSFVTKDSYTYDSNGNILTKASEGFRFQYKYNADGRIARIECRSTAKGSLCHLDSFAWRTGIYLDTMEHWSPGTGNSYKDLTDSQVFSNLTGQETEYALYADKKYNYIRGLMGPVKQQFSYDAGYRLVRKTNQTIEGVLINEKVYTYDTAGLIAGFQLLSVRESNDPRGLPPSAQNYNGNLFVGTEFAYTSSNPGARMPDEMVMKSTLIGIKGESREILAHGTKNGLMMMIVEYYE